MSTQSPTIGKQIDTDVRVSSPSTDIPKSQLRTVHDLLVALESEPDIGMLRTTASHLSRMLDVSLVEMSIGALVNIGPRFKCYLKERHYPKNSVRSYLGYARKLLKKAAQLGWTPAHPEVARAWNAVRATVTAHGESGTIVNYAIAHDIHPSRFSKADLENWREEMARLRRACEYLDKLSSRFRRAMADAGFKQDLGAIRPWKVHYGIPLSQFPAQLRSEVEALLQWKQARFADGRKRRSKHRTISARELQAFVSQLYGFWTGVLGNADVNNLPELVTHASVSSFVGWLLNERETTTNPLRCKLGMLYAALTQHPAYGKCDFAWFAKLINELEDDEDEDAKRQKRKLDKTLPYDTLAEIPAKIHALRNSGLRPYELALLVHDELLMQWLITLPWRQRNIRECRLGANIFKADIPQSASIAKPQWVEEALRMNPHEPLWQFRFGRPETKAGHEVHALLPRQLVALLEEYLSHHRSVLLQGRTDPGTLFLNRDGTPLTTHELRYLVGNLTLHHGGRRVTPHLFRDIFAYKWLEDHPEDYLTLSKILWHQNIKTTLRIYGRNFNESNGTRRVEEWLDKRYSSK